MTMPTSEQDEVASVGRIEATRRVNRKAADKCVERGATIEEVAIAAVYSAFDIAERHAGPGQSAIEWLRTAVDVLEQGGPRHVVN